MVRSFARRWAAVARPVEARAARCPTWLGAACSVDHPACWAVITTAPPMSRQSSSHAILRYFPQAFALCRQGHCRTLAALKAEQLLFSVRPADECRRRHGPWAGSAPLSDRLRQ